LLKGYPKGATIKDCPYGQLDLEESGTVRDRINHAEKKGLLSNANDFVDIRELRNSIAHEYDSTAMLTIFTDVMHYCPMLFDAVERVHCYSQKYQPVNLVYLHYLPSH
jgi:hypothetical protein